MTKPGDPVSNWADAYNTMNNMLGQQNTVSK